VVLKKIEKIQERVCGSKIRQWFLFTKKSKNRSKYRGYVVLKKNRLREGILSKNHGSYIKKMSVRLSTPDEIEIDTTN